MPHVSSVQTGVVIDTAIANSSVISFSDQVLGQIDIVSGASLTTITWSTSPDGVTWYLATEVGTAGVDSRTFAVGSSFRIPLEIMAARYIKAVGNAAGVATVTVKT